MMSRMKSLANAASRVGSRLGNMNDRLARHDSYKEASRRWRLVDRVCGMLYTLPDRKRSGRTARDTR